MTMRMTTRMVRKIYMITLLQRRTRCAETKPMHSQSHMPKPRIPPASSPVSFPCKQSINLKKNSQKFGCRVLGLQGIAFSAPEFKEFRLGLYGTLKARLRA